MAEFSAADAAFTGFRIVWERPWIVAIWGALQFVVQLALNVFIAYSAGPVFNKIGLLDFTQASQKSTETLDLFRQAAPTAAVIMIVLLVLNSAVYAAMNRAVFHPEQSRFGYLRLAADELRQLGLFVLYALLGFAIYLGLAVVMALLLMILGLTTTGALAVIVLMPILLVIIVFVGVRFSLASPLTYATKRIDLFGSWELTKGRFWPLFSAYAIAFALRLVVSLLVFAIAALLTTLVGGSAAEALAPNDTSSVAAVLASPRLVSLAVTSIGQTLGWPITISPPAAIYRQIAGPQAGPTSRVFD